MRFRPPADVQDLVGSKPHIYSIVNIIENRTQRLNSYCDERCSETKSFPLFPTICEPEIYAGSVFAFFSNHVVDSGGVISGAAKGSFGSISMSRVSTKLMSFS